MAATDRTAEELAAEVDSGSRHLTGGLERLIPVICFIWSIYQLYIASPIPSLLTQHTGIDFFYFIGNLSISRKVHLTFAIVLASLAYPLYKSAPRDRIPVYDWVLLTVGIATILYMLVLNSHIGLSVILLGR